MRIIGLPGRTNRASVVEHAAADCRPVDRAGLRVGLRRPYVASVRGMPDGHQHALYRMAVSSASGTVTLSAEAVEERVRGQLERGEITMGKIRADYARYCK